MNKKFNTAINLSKTENTPTNLNINTAIQIQIHAWLETFSNTFLYFDFHEIFYNQKGLPYFA